MHTLCPISCADPPRSWVEGAIWIWFWVKDGMCGSREVESLGISSGGQEGARQKEKEESDKKISGGGGKIPTKISSFSLSCHFHYDMPEHTILIIIKILPLYT